jgi:hypothetical protein
MTQPAWHAYYYEGLDTAHPPVRTEWIEAVSEDQAAQIARGRMGHCRRVELLRPRWEGSQGPIVVLSDAALAPPHLRTS